MHSEVFLPRSPLSPPCRRRREHRQAGSSTQGAAYRTTAGGTSHGSQRQFPRHMRDRSPRVTLASLHHLRRLEPHPFASTGAGNFPGSIHRAKLRDGGRTYANRHEYGGNATVSGRDSRARPARAIVWMHRHEKRRVVQYSDYVPERLSERRHHQRERGFQLHAGQFGER
jgi:hypothetical protein